MECDVIITTAAIPGRPSPKLITDEMVADMKPGSVIVDLAAAGGGNCTLTKKGEIVTTENNVKIIGYDDLASRMATQSSNMYANNMYNLFSHIHDKAEKGPSFLGKVDEALNAPGDEGEIIWRSIVTSKNGKEVTAPPPPEPTPVKPKAEVKAKEVVVVDPMRQAMVTSGSLVGLSGLVLGMGTGVSP